MRVEYSRDFAKSMRKLSGKLLKSVVAAINEVIDATGVEDITDCKKLEAFNSVYRIRIGDRRAFFVLHVEIKGDVVKFEYLVSRGEAYGRKSMEKLSSRDI